MPSSEAEVPVAGECRPLKLRWLETRAAFTDVAAAMADAPGPVLSPDILEAYLRADHRPRLQPPDPVNRGPSPGTSNDYAPSDFVPGASPPADFPSESAVQPALAQLAAVPSAVRNAAGGGEDSEDVGDRRHPDPGAAFFPMPCDGAEILRASCSSAPPTRAQCTHLLLLCLPTWPLYLVSSIAASSILAQPGGRQHSAPFRQWLLTPCSGSHIPFGSASSMRCTSTISLIWHIVSTSPAWRRISPRHLSAPTPCEP
jgi:hypothetical protein